jgi:fluoroacetyl-CoA thioesterase
MKNPFTKGDCKVYRKKITNDDTAAFETGLVHPFYATFALGRDAEWASRLFVLDMKEEDEEGIGTFLNIKHHSPALFGEEVTFEANIFSIEKNSIICHYIARVGERIIATGETGQKILKKEKLNSLFEKLNNNQHED